MSDFRILLPTDKDSVLNYGKARLALTMGEPMELEMQSWNARWRAEALDHYLPQGWSFGAFDGAELCGVILGQPFLFYRGLTQTLWIEHLEANTPDLAKQLLDIAQRWARDKHLQCVLLENSVHNAALLIEFPRAHLLDDRWIEIRSTRF